MSFINSLIARYAGGEPSTSPVSATNPATSPKGVQPPLRSTPSSEMPTKTNDAAGTGQKRRAEEELERIMAKAPKRDGLARGPSALTDSKTTTGNHPNSAKPKALSSSTTKTHLSHSTSPSPLTTAKKPRDPPAANVPKPPPKKGSYAEILLRANAAQAIAPKVGIIKHKPVEGGLRRRDRINQRREGKELSKKPTKMGTLDSKSEKLLPSGKSGEKDKPTKGNTSGSTYRGTARVKPEMPQYRGTARVSNQSPTKPASKRENMERYPGRSTSLHTGSSRYHTSEEDEEDEEDYYESSDMEAAPFELEEEEHISLITGKREDEEALKEELRLKKQKEERKKMLAAKRR